MNKTYSTTIKKFKISISLHCCHQVITWWSPRCFTINKKHNKISLISEAWNLSHLGEICAKLTERECLLSLTPFSKGSFVMVVSMEIFDCEILDTVDKFDSILAHEKPLAKFWPAIAAKYVESLKFTEALIGESMCDENLIT